MKKVPFLEWRMKTENAFFHIFLSLQIPLVFSIKNCLFYQTFKKYVGMLEI